MTPALSQSQFKYMSVPLLDLATHPRTTIASCIILSVVCAVEVGDADKGKQDRLGGICVRDYGDLIGGRGSSGDNEANNQ